MGNILSTTRAEAHNNTAHLVGGDDPQSASVAGQGAAHEFANGVQNGIGQANIPQASHNLLEGAASHLPEAANNAAVNLAQGATNTAVNSEAAQDVAGGIANFGTGAGVGAAATGVGAAGIGGGALAHGIGSMQRQQAEGRGLEAEHEANAARTNVTAQGEQQERNQQATAAVPEHLTQEDRAAQEIAERGIRALRAKLPFLQPGPLLRVYVGIVACGDTALQQFAEDKLEIFLREATTEYGDNIVKAIGPTGVCHDIDTMFEEVLGGNRMDRAYATESQETLDELFWYTLKLNYAKLHIRKKLGFGRRDATDLDIPEDYDWDTPHVQAHVLILLLTTPGDQKTTQPYMLLPEQPILPSLLIRGSPDKSPVSGAQIHYTSPSLHFLGLEHAGRPQIVLDGVHLLGSSPQSRGRYGIMQGPGRDNPGELLILTSHYYRYAKDPRLWSHKGVHQYFWGSGNMAIWDLNNCFEGIGFKRDGKIYTTPFERGREIVYETIVPQPSKK